MVMPSNSSLALLTHAQAAFPDQRWIAADTLRRVFPWPDRVAQLLPSAARGSTADVHRLSAAGGARRGVDVHLRHDTGRELENSFISPFFRKIKCSLISAQFGKQFPIFVFFDRMNRGSNFHKAHEKSERCYRPSITTCASPLAHILAVRSDCFYDCGSCMAVLAWLRTGGKSCAGHRRNTDRHAIAGHPGV